MKKLSMIIIAIVMTFATLQAQAATSEQFLKAVAFFWNGSEQTKYSVTSDGMKVVESPIWHTVFFMDKEDSCVVHVFNVMEQAMGVKPGEKKLFKSTYINFRNMPSPRAFEVTQMSTGWANQGIATNWRVSLPARVGTGRCRTA